MEFDSIGSLSLSFYLLFMSSLVVQWNSYNFFNFHRNSIILHILSTQMLKYKLVQFKSHIFIHLRITDKLLVRITIG